MPELAYPSRTHGLVDILDRVLDKGLVKVRNFERSDRKLAYAYLLTPAGIREKLSLTRSFLARLGRLVLLAQLHPAADPSLRHTADSTASPVTLRQVVFRYLCSAVSTLI